MNTHVSRLTSHVSRLTSHVSRLTSHVSRLKEQFFLVVFFLVLTFSQAHSQTITGPRTLVGHSGSNVCESTPWKLVFHDEFNGTQLDKTKWLSYFPCDAAQTDNCLFSRTHTTTIVSALESQVFKDENLNVSNGLLTISIKKDFPTWKGAQRTFSSGTIYSNNVFRFQRGKFEIRCKLASGKGLWPSFWIFGGETGTGATEIDVFEFRENQSCYFEMSLHHWLPNGDNNLYAQKTVNNGVDYSQAFHTFAVEWDGSKVSWLVDGQIVNSALRLYENVAAQKNSSCSPPFGSYYQYDWFPHFPSDQVHVVAGVGIEGGTPPPSNEIFPKQMEIDYIRVYQREPEQWFPPICVLSGPEIICAGQNSTFTLPEDLGTLTWTASSNLTIVSQSNTSITVRSKPNVAFGDAFVKANFAQQSVCGSTSSTKNFWIGQPNPINVVEYVGFCESCYSIDATCSPNSKASFVWDGSGYIVPTSCSNFGPNYTIPYTVTATNICGSQFASGILSPPYCEFGPMRTSVSISVSPNPSNSTTRVNLNNINLKDIAQIVILNRSGAVVRTFTSGFVASFDINVSSYQNGLYNITVMRKANQSSISSQFTVQH